MPLLRRPQNPTPKYTGLCLLVRAIFPQEKDANPLPGIKGASVLHNHICLCSGGS